MVNLVWETIELCYIPKPPGLRTKIIFWIISSLQEDGPRLATTFVLATVWASSVTYGHMKLVAHIWATICMHVGQMIDSCHPVCLHGQEWAGSQTFMWPTYTTWLPHVGMCMPAAAQIANKKLDVKPYPYIRPLWETPRTNSIYSGGSHGQG